MGELVSCGSHRMGQKLCAPLAAVLPQAVQPTVSVSLRWTDLRGGASASSYKNPVLAVINGRIVPYLTRWRLGETQRSRILRRALRLKSSA